jgi:hypothetical protein
MVFGYEYHAYLPLINLGYITCISMCVSLCSTMSQIVGMTMLVNQMQYNTSRLGFCDSNPVPILELQDENSLFDIHRLYMAMLVFCYCYLVEGIALLLLSPDLQGLN